MITAQQVHEMGLIVGIANAPLLAAYQRKVFGVVIFGKQRVRYLGKRWEVRCTTVSRDICYMPVTNEQVARAINEGKKIVRGNGGGMIVE